MNYNYTIIIPHKNIPDLLQRCLKSIPERDDTQIIIVDDNSDSSIVDFDNFPGNNRKNTKVIFSKKGGGAGYARNLALASIVSTKWVTFVDADDFLSNEVNVLMDKYAYYYSDIIYFKSDSVYSDTLLPSDRKHDTNNKIDKAVKSKNYDILRYKMYGPVAKFISHAIISDNNIKFDEVIAANDVMFSLKTGHYAEKIEVDKSVFYIVTEREGSLVKTISYTNMKSRYYVGVEAIRFLMTNNKGEYSPNIFSYSFYFYQINTFLTIKYTLKSFYYTPLRYWFTDLKQCFTAFKDIVQANRNYL